MHEQISLCSNSKKNKKKKMKKFSVIKNGVSYLQAVWRDVSLFGPERHQCASLYFVGLLTRSTCFNVLWRLSAYFKEVRLIMKQVFCKRLQNFTLGHEAIMG